MYIFKFFYRKTDTKKVGEVSRYAPTGYDVTIEKVKAMPIPKRVIGLHAFKTMPCKYLQTDFDLSH